MKIGEGVVENECIGKGEREREREREREKRERERVTRYMFFDNYGPSKSICLFLTG